MGSGKHDNEWSIETGEYDSRAREVEINNVVYRVKDDTACLAHALLLLTDAVKEVGAEIDGTNGFR